MALTQPKFQLDATGAVNRDVQSKLKERISVADFGASKTATPAVNAAAITAAINYVG